MLLDEGKLEIEAPDPMDAEKALGHAAIKGHGNICRILVANNADPNSPMNADPNSPMIDTPILTQTITEYYANKGQTEGTLEVFDLLLELGADVNAENLEGVPVLTDKCHKSTPEQCFCPSSLGTPRYRRQSC